MNLPAIFEALENTPVATAIREGDSSFPWLESVHVLAITLVVGTIAIVDLRLIGYASHRRGAARLIAELLPFTWAAFALAAVTGALMFLSNAVKYSENPLFLAKLCLIAIAGANMTIFHLGPYRRIALWDDQAPPPASVRFAGFSSLALWLCVIALGRWVGFV